MENKTIRMRERAILRLIEARESEVALVLVKDQRYELRVESDQVSYTIETHRGAVRQWSSLDSAMGWIRRHLPGLGQVVLRLLGTDRALAE